MLSRPDIENQINHFGMPFFLSSGERHIDDIFWETLEQHLSKIVGLVQIQAFEYLNNINYGIRKI